MAKRKLIKDKILSVKVNGKQLAEFRAYCDRTVGMEYQHVVREMMLALTEGRLKITMSDDQKQLLRGLYNVD